MAITLDDIQRFMTTEEFIIAVRDNLAKLNTYKADDNAVLHKTLLNAANGVAGLDANGKIPANLLDLSASKAL